MQVYPDMGRVEKVVCPPAPPLLALPLLAAYGPDTVAAFEQAAQQRFDEGVVLLPAHPSGAVYLFGYSVEASLKAAWFRLMGHGLAVPIVATDWDAARDLARQSGVLLGNLHNIAAWVRWLIISRISVARPYLAGLGAILQTHADLVHQFWTPTLRYRGAVLTPADANAVHGAAAWVLAQYPNL